MERIKANVCLYVSEGATLRCYMTGSNEACVEIGEVDHELTFDYPAFRELVTQANAVLGQMEAEADAEEAAWEAEQARRSAAELAGREGPS